MTDDRDFTAYVAARWAPLVRSLLALGAPLGAAESAATDALSRCHDDWDSREEWPDVDVHVFRLLLDTWDGRAGAWWDHPLQLEEDDEELAATAWPRIEPALDRMPLAQRQALVLLEVAGLRADQARAVAGVEPGQPDPALLADLHGVLDLLAVDPPQIEAMIAASRERRRRRRRTALAATVAVLVVAGVVTALVVREDEAAPEEPPGAFGPVRSVPSYNASPIPFYANGRLYLTTAVVQLRDVREFAVWDDGAVYLDVSGNLVTVTPEGDRGLITNLGPEGSFEVTDLDDRVVWVDPEAPELVHHDLETGERLLEVALPDPGEVAYVEGGRAYVASDATFYSVDLDDGEMYPAVDPRLPFELDRNGEFVLTLESAGLATSQVQLSDTSTGRRVPLGIDDPADVSAARFAPDGAVILLVEREAAQISEVHRCEPPYDRCPRIEFYTPGGARAILAD